MAKETKTPETGATQENAKVTAPAIVKPEPTSDKLTELKAQKAANFTAIKSAKTEEEADGLMLEGYKIKEQIKAEIANLRKMEAEQELAEKRNARIKLVDDLISAATSGDADKLASAREVIVNELLARYATSSPAKKADGDAKPAGSRGSTGTAIKERLLFHMTAGKTPSEAVTAVIAEDYSRGTTGAVRTAMRKAGELAAFGENPE